MPGREPEHWNGLTSIQGKVELTQHCRKQEKWYYKLRSDVHYCDFSHYSSKCWGEERWYTEKYPCFSWKKFKRVSLLVLTQQYFQTILLGQTIHAFVCLVATSLPQGSPPHLGAGLVHCLTRVCTPLTHILLQLDQDVHSDKPPLTAWKWKKWAEHNEYFKWLSFVFYQDKKIS